MDEVLAYVTAMNRPLNATNVGDALGSRGVKKGLAQKYLETLAEKGKIGVKEAGKQKVYFPPQDDEVLSAEELKAMEVEVRTKQEEGRGLSAEVKALRLALRDLENVQTTKELSEAKKALEKENAELEAKLAPLRDDKENGVVISEAERVKIEDAFLKSMEVWLERRRKFNNLFETVLEGTGAAKKKLWDDLGAENEADHSIDYDKYRKAYDDVKKQRIVDARMKRMKRC